MTIYSNVDPAKADQPKKFGERPLDMVQREKYAQGVAMGMTSSDALRATDPERFAQIKPNSVHRMAVGLSQDMWVINRIAEIRAATAKLAEERIGIDRLWVIANLKSVAERAMAAEPVLIRDPETKEMIPSGEWTFNAAGANKALELLGKEIGMFVDRKEIRTGPLDGMSNEAIEEALAKLKLIEAPAHPASTATVQ